MHEPTPSKYRFLVVTGLGLLLLVGGLFWLVTALTRDGATSTAASAEETAPRPGVSTPVPPSPTSEPAAPASTPVAPSPTSEPAAPASTPVAPSPTSEPSVVVEPTVLPASATTEVVLLQDDLRTGSREFSAVALNEERERLIIADDEGRLFEFDLAEDGTPITPARRTIFVAIGAGDIEGIAWISDTTYVIAHENDGRLTVVQIEEDSTVVATENVLRTIDTGIREENGNGLEGVAYHFGPSAEFEFAAVDERPPTLVLIDASGAIQSSIPLDLGVSDVSDVWVGPDNTFTILSDEFRILKTFEINDAGTIIVLDEFVLPAVDGFFNQPEGLVRSRDGHRLYIVGEDPGLNRYSFGLWTSD